MSHLLEVRNLQTRFKTSAGEVRAVDGISLHLDKGETLGVVGESGSGKSVTSLSIMRLIAPQVGRIVAGEIVFDGVDLLKLSEEEMRKVRGGRISMIFQDPMSSLNPVLTVGRQITETMELHLGLTKKQAVSRAADLLALVGIPSPRQRLDSYPHEFSGGMRQRVMIAIALACNPELLIADEPTTALDVTVQAQILELLKSLQAELGMAMILVTHDLGVVAGMADRVQVIYAGRSVEQGQTQAVFSDPRMPYTIGLLGSLPRPGAPKSRLVSIKGRPPVIVDQRESCSFSPRCPFTQSVCQVGDPELRVVGERHRAACHFASEALAARLTGSAPVQEIRT